MNFSQFFDKEQILKKLSKRYKIVVLSDRTFEEKFTIRITIGRMLVWLSSLSVLLLVLLVYMLTSSSILETDASMRRKFMMLHEKADSLQITVLAQETYIKNLQDILNGKLDVARLRDKPNIVPQSQSILASAPKRPVEDVELKQMIEQEGLVGKEKQQEVFRRLKFVKPVKGILIEPFNLNKRHIGVDIAASSNAPVHAVLEGKVVFSEYTKKTGYVITIKHSNGLMTYYKHCSVLLKKVGTFVQTGDEIAAVGNTGEYSTGPHLHFEIWSGNTPIDPRIVFNFKK